MIIDMTVVELSEKVLDRAEELTWIGTWIHPYSNVLGAIACPFGPEDQATLAQHGITDEATAIAFLDLVEPVIQEWAVQYRVILERQEKEMQEFFRGLEA